MKVTVNIDCTPQEARQFFGLPDVQPLQAAFLTEIEKRMMAELERFSPQGLMRTWLSGTPQNVELFQKMFGDLFQQGQAQEKPNVRRAKAT